MASDTAPTFLVVGQCGDGKSSFIKALSGSSTISCGDDPAGVTKTLQAYPAGRIRLVDTPGIGDSDINPTMLLVLLETYCQKNPVHGLIIVSKDYARLTMGARMVVKLMDIMFPDKGKWDSVLFVWTHKDLNTKKVANLPKIVMHVNKEINGQFHRSCAVSVPEGEPQDLQDFNTHVNSILQKAGVGQFQRPTPEKLTKLVVDTMGEQFGNSAEVLKKIKEAEAAVRNAEAAMRRAQEEARDARRESNEAMREAMRDIRERDVRERKEEPQQTNEGHAIPCAAIGATVGIVGGPVGVAIGSVIGGWVGWMGS